MPFLYLGGVGARELIIVPDDDEEEWNGFSDEEMSDTEAGDQADTEEIDGQKPDNKEHLSEMSPEVGEEPLVDKYPDDGRSGLFQHTTEEDTKTELNPQPGTRRKTRNSMSPEARAEEFAKRTAATIGESSALVVNPADLVPSCRTRQSPSQKGHQGHHRNPQGGLGARSPCIRDRSDRQRRNS
jgi:hypothetical protein